MTKAKGAKTWIGYFVIFTSGLIAFSESKVTNRMVLWCYVYSNIVECFKTPCQYLCHVFLGSGPTTFFSSTLPPSTLSREIWAFEHLGLTIGTVGLETITNVSLRVLTQYLTYARDLDVLLTTVHQVERKSSLWSFKINFLQKLEKSTKIVIFLEGIIFISDMEIL